MKNGEDGLHFFAASCFARHTSIPDLVGVKKLKSIQILFLKFRRRLLLRKSLFFKDRDHLTSELARHLHSLRPQPPYNTAPPRLFKPISSIATYHYPRKKSKGNEERYPTPNPASNPPITAAGGSRPNTRQRCDSAQD